MVMKNRRGSKPACVCGGKIRVKDVKYKRKWKFGDKYERYEIGQIERVRKCERCGMEYRGVERIFKFKG